MRMFNGYLVDVDDDCEKDLVLCRDGYVFGDIDYDNHDCEKYVDFVVG